jgi:hypothetical protein
MSRAYRIQVQGSVERIVHLEDGVEGSLEMLPILPKERMSAILEGELVRRGYESDGKVCKKAAGDGISVEIDLDGQTVTVRAESDLKQSVRVDVEGRSASIHDGAAREGLQNQADEQALAQADREAKAQEQKVTEKLEGVLKDLKGEVDRAVNKTMAEALKERARAMGEIEEVAEDEEKGTVSIKVKL